MNIFSLLVGISSFQIFQNEQISVLPDSMLCVPGELEVRISACNCIKNALIVGKREKKKMI